MIGILIFFALKCDFIPLEIKWAFDSDWNQNGTIFSKKIAFDWYFQSYIPLNKSFCVGNQKKESFEC